jgi:hypothetical protein
MLKKLISDPEACSGMETKSINCSPQTWGKGLAAALTISFLVF